MPTLVLNCGSSSLKFAVIDVVTGATLASGLAEKLFEEQPLLSCKKGEDKSSQTLTEQGHTAALKGILAFLQSAQLLDKIQNIGHRVVHGGEAFKTASQITPEVIDAIKACIPLAPLHNPANLLGIQGALAAFPQLPQVAVFDTAFHQTMPAVAYQYAIPQRLYRDFGVRRYGFHGTSHQYVCQQAAQTLGKPLADTCLISAHLGNGCSIAAVKGGHSVDTSMGMTPLEGLVMGTRSGDIDPNLHQYLAAQLNTDLNAITHLLNHESGLLGISELSNDCRTLEQAAQEGHTGAQLALAIFCYRLAKYIASMAVPLGRIDALIFTGGIGENSIFIRQTTLKHLAILGFKIDDIANQKASRGVSGCITAADSTPAWVINTNEELMIAQQTQEVLA